VKKKKENIEVLKVNMGLITTVFSVDEEKELVAYLKLMEGRLFGLSSGDFRKLAYQLAIKNNINHNFNNDKKEAGYDWLKGFERGIQTYHFEAMGFNKPVVTTFCRFLGEVLDKYKFQSDRIFNCDETGISNVPISKSKILASKGRKQVGSLTSAERGQTVTVELCVSASGIYMPPMMIFPRVRTNLEYLRNCPPEFTAEFHPSGWMQTDIFYRWLKKFIQFTHASKNNPVLLLLDGHATHTKNINLINLARENGVVMLCFPPHCTHRLQPLDVGVIKPISTYYDPEVTNWLRSNTPKVVTLKDIGEIFGKAFMKSATISTAINSFKKT
ncbi:Pogo transposable element with KRAB domain, partial [Aphis craccivora]